MRKSVHSREYKELTRLLTEARKAAGFTQQELARKLRKHQSFVAKYERGERRLDVIEFIQIVGAMGRDPMDLFADLIARH